MPHTTPEHSLNVTLAGKPSGTGVSRAGAGVGINGLLSVACALASRRRGFDLCAELGCARRTAEQETALAPALLRFCRAVC